MEGSGVERKANVGHWDALQGKWGAVGGTRRQTEESEVYGREIGGLQRCTFFWVHQKLNGVILRG